jgi:hypothetical protein
MQAELHPLPVRVDPLDGESGRSYLFRVARQNGLTLRRMLEWSAVTSMEAVSQADVALLSYLAQCPRHWLMPRLPSIRDRNGVRLVRLLGVTWSSRAALSCSRPQICPQCLREYGACRETWEVTGMFGCPKHECPLIDRCARCGVRLNWDRPALDVCRCGAFLSPCDLRLSKSQLLWLRALDDALEGRFVHQLADGLPPWLRALSPDGLFWCVHAFGIRRGSLGKVQLPSSSRAVDRSELMEILGRGVDRVRQVVEFKSPLPKEFARLIHDEGLERLEVRGGTEADCLVAGSLRDWLRDVPRVGTSRSGRRPTRQMDLFRGGHDA